MSNSKLNALVTKVWNENKNYIVRYNETATSKEWCAVYFASNDLYYPE
jgi:hypothetical protein